MPSEFYLHLVNQSCKPPCLWDFFVVLCPTKRLKSDIQTSISTFEARNGHHDICEREEHLRQRLEIQACRKGRQGKAHLPEQETRPLQVRTRDGADHGADEAEKEKR